MSEKLTKRDVALFTMMFLAPIISFTLVVYDDGVLLKMMEEPILKPVFGFTSAWIWLTVWGVALFIDSQWKKRIERRDKAMKGSELMVDDPTLAFGQYLFDKDRD